MDGTYGLPSIDWCWLLLWIWNGICRNLWLASSVSFNVTSISLEADELITFVSHLMNQHFQTNFNHVKKKMFITSFKIFRRCYPYYLSQAQVWWKTNFVQTSSSCLWARAWSMSSVLISWACTRADVSAIHLRVVLHEFLHSSSNSFWRFCKRWISSSILRGTKVNHSYDMMTNLVQENL